MFRSYKSNTKQVLGSSVGCAVRTESKSRWCAQRTLQKILGTQSRFACWSVFAYALIFIFLFVCGVQAAEVAQSEQGDLSKVPSLEIEMLGIRLGMPYVEAVSKLTLQYHAPIVLSKQKTSFWLDQKNKTTFEITSDGEKFPAVVELQIKGHKPIPLLNFYNDLNLGEPEKYIIERFPFYSEKKASKGSGKIFDIEASNVQIETEHQKITSLKIFKNERITIIKGQKRSLGLTPNELAQAFPNSSTRHTRIDDAKIDALLQRSEDLLKPFCNTRTPLRLKDNGLAYIDVLLKSRYLKHDPIPVRMLLDTSRLFTSITKESCRTYNCMKKTYLEEGEKNPAKDLNPNRPEFKDVIPPKVEFIALHDVLLGGLNYEIDFTAFSEHADVTPSEYEGTLGFDIFTRYPLFINFKHGYVCHLPKSTTVAKIAQQLGLHQTPITEFKLEGIKTDFLINYQAIKNVLLDSGTVHSAFLQADLDTLNLSPMASKIQNPLIVHDFFKLYAHESAWMTWLNTSRRMMIPDIMGPSPFYVSWLGASFLRHTILGFDRAQKEKGNVYIGG